MSFYRNAEGYYDPTAGEALSNIAKQEQKKQREPCCPVHSPLHQYKKPDAELGDPCHALANAIIVQAVDEYREALRVLRKHPDNREAKAAADEIEHFFRSEWFGFLTSVNGEMLIRKLKEESR